MEHAVDDVLVIMSGYRLGSPGVEQPGMVDIYWAHLPSEPKALTKVESRK